MAVRSRELLERLDIRSSNLLRWRRAGYVTPDTVGPCRSAGHIWPDWTLRLGTILRGELTGDGGRNDRQVTMLRSTAEVLAVFPDVPYIVIGDDGCAMPAWTAAEVCALHGQSTCSTVISPPALEALP